MSSIFSPVSLTNAVTKERLKLKCHGFEIGEEEHWGNGKGEN